MCGTALLLAAVLVLLPGHTLQTGFDIDLCPPWYKYNGTDCVCGNTSLTGDLVRCEENGTTWLLLDYCMTYDGDINDTILFYCPYSIANRHKHIANMRYLSIDARVSKLISFFCSKLNRKGPYCEHCKPDYGPSVFTQRLKCYNCTKPFSGWMFYLACEYFPLSIFFVIIICTGISPRNGNLNAFVLLSQLVSLLFTYGNQDQLFPPGSNPTPTHYLFKTLQTFYGVWNLDLFRGVIPNFCVSSTLNNLQAISLLLIPPFYPFLLLMIISVCIYLHHRNFRPFVRAWKPFNRCLSHYPVPNDLRHSMIRLFVTFYLLGYSKILSTCTFLLVRGSLFELNEPDTKTILMMSPDIEYFSQAHIPYAAAAVTLLILLIILPAVYLTLYPLIEKRCVTHRRLLMIQMTTDAFSSCFRDGKDGRMDCRHFAGAYLLLRIVVVMLFSVIWSPKSTYITLFAVFFLAGVTVGVCRPYRRTLHNVIDVLFFILASFAFLFAFLANISGMNDPLQTGLTIVAVICLLPPLLYGAVYITYQLVKLIIFLVVHSCKKRHHYEEITKYDDDGFSSDEHH